jgi:hypothetical protein
VKRVAARARVHLRYDFQASGGGSRCRRLCLAVHCARLVDVGASARDRDFARRAQRLRFPGNRQTLISRWPGNAAQSGEPRMHSRRTAGWADTLGVPWFGECGLPPALIPCPVGAYVVPLVGGQPINNSGETLPENEHPHHQSAAPAHRSPRLRGGPVQLPIGIRAMRLYSMPINAFLPAKTSTPPLFQRLQET